ncbi:hypothetical protein O3M35_007525 [Rhynocoris fuscipes]|uniref:mTERF domain-containing protein n=1 Tax=Rhynocoris fuscipes TaxID=488301 RepID=A0AAW1D9Q8_9HEMI
MVSVFYSRNFSNKVLPNSAVNHNYCLEANNNIERQEIESILFRYGFNSENINKIINASPDIIKVSKENLLINLNSWLQCQFGEKQLITLILRHPNLLFVNSKRINKLYSFLLSKYTKNYTYKIFFNSPQLLMDSESTIEEKFSYLENEMMVPKAEIVNSTALGCSLYHIKERHEILKRVGIYKLPNKKAIDSVNPRLDLIMSSTDKQFANKVAGISLLEYEVFQQLFKNELED